MTPNRQGIWDVEHAANGLTSQARTLGARYLKEGAARLRFGREVAYYARRIADDVALGKITSEQGLQAFQANAFKETYASFNAARSDAFVAFRA